MVIINKKFLILFLSVVGVFFLTAQTCTWTTATACTASGQVVCEDGTAYECVMSSYGTGFYLDRIYSTDVADLPDEVQEEVYACTGEVVVEETLVVEETPVEVPVVDEVELCGVVCGALVAEIEALQANIAIAEGTSATMLGSYSTASTEKLLEQIDGALVVQHALDGIQTDLSDIAADLAVLDADYDITLEEALLADAEASLATAQIDITSVIDMMDTELSTRWVPVTTNEVLSASVIRAGTPVSGLIPTPVGTPTLVPQSDVYFWVSYLSSGGSLYAYYTLGELTMSGSFTVPAIPSSYSGDLLVGGISDMLGGTWAGYDSEVIEVEYLNSLTSNTHTLTLYLPEEDAGNLDIDYMVYYVAADGSTFYVNSAGVPWASTTPFPSAESVMKRENLARACDTSCT